MNADSGTRKCSAALIKITKNVEVTLDWIIGRSLKT